MDPTAPPPAAAPAPAGLFTRGAATALDILVVLLLGLGVQWLVREPLATDRFFLAVLLNAAIVRVLTESVFGASPGKWLSGVRVKFPEQPRWMRLPQSLLRNAWLWLVPLSMQAGPMEDQLWAPAAALAATIIIGPDQRSASDMLAAAFVIDPSAPRRVPDPVDHVSPRRALAWAVDMTLAAIIGLALAPVLDWSWWARGLLVLAVLRLVTETAGIPSPGKALLQVRVDYPAGRRLLRVIARSLWLVPALLIAAAVPHTLLLVEGFIALTFLYHPAHRSATDLLAQATVRLSG